MRRIQERDTQRKAGFSPGDRAAALKPAGPAEPPPLSRPALGAAEEQRAYVREREMFERRSMLRGLILLALLVIVFAVVHNGWQHALPDGWWRQW